MLPTIRSAALILTAVLTACSPGPDHTYPTTARPGLKPELFAPGLISTENHRERDLAISPDWSELYFTRDGRRLVGA